MGKDAENVFKDTEKKFLEAVDAVMDRDENRRVWEKELGPVPPSLLDKVTHVIFLSACSLISSPCFTSDSHFAAQKTCRS